MFFVALAVVLTILSLVQMVRMSRRTAVD
jgi:hypothetical protein